MKTKCSNLFKALGVSLLAHYFVFSYFIGVKKDDELFFNPEFSAMASRPAIISKLYRKSEKSSRPVAPASQPPRASPRAAARSLEAFPFPPPAPTPSENTFSETPHYSEEAAEGNIFLVLPDEPLGQETATARLALYFDGDGIVDRVEFTYSELPQAYENAVSEAFIGKKMPHKNFQEKMEIEILVSAQGNIAIPKMDGGK